MSLCCTCMHHGQLYNRLYKQVYTNVSHNYIHGTCISYAYYALYWTLQQYTNSMYNAHVGSKAIHIPLNTFITRYSNITVKENVGIIPCIRKEHSKTTQIK